MGRTRRGLPRAKDSRYLFGWSASVAALAFLVGLSLFLLITSFDAEGSAGRPVAGLPGGFEQRMTLPPVDSTTLPPPPPPRPTHKARPKAPAKTATARPRRTTPPPRSPQPTQPAQKVTMTSPAWGQRVSGREGVVVAGTATDLDGAELRIFDQADDGKFYLVDGHGVDVDDGRWSLHYRGIGGDGRDIGDVFVLTAVVADGGCEEVLDEADPNREGDRPFGELPEGCDIVDRVPVVKVAP